MVATDHFTEMQQPSQESSLLIAVKTYNGMVKMNQKRKKAQTCVLK